MHDVMGWLWKWDDYNPHVRWLQSSHPPPVVDPPPTWTARHRSHPSARRSKGPSPRFGSQREAFRIFWDGEIICKCCFFVNKYIYIVYIYICIHRHITIIWICIYEYVCVCIHISCMTVWLSMLDFHELDTSGLINGESHGFSAGLDWG